MLVNISIKVDRDTFHPLLGPGVVGKVTVWGHCCDGPPVRLTGDDIFLEAVWRETEIIAYSMGTQHNPTITRIDDLYVLSYHSAMGTLTDRRRDTIRIGLM